MKSKLKVEMEGRSASFEGDLAGMADIRFMLNTLVMVFRDWDAVK